ncbi:cell death-inducing p53-target protein 1 homolog [Aplysia californica]|uniref:Cell death-inducing p53-target protein 1 homolog n=1 Tax=Aplysia californica TaxID=6500 RepID=A0ABM0K7B9_APLCA|nr:cell death-inducing p53-target protein 1 homolog [Aplysia californica]XP_012944633.1 cell death-inducing p53-target protein 1 homolog [Aplysia californica]XP_035828776.1 cell death-inducing p53-target protein 1 homolog [Aplysia californica]XP_035828777.1 cell death-inducing p53-target protein 1 homolog [Aplysia californica]XP_035828778.1 cell death-inducing p53-target protein 1 homolog [Aplysia californica]
MNPAPNEKPPQYEPAAGGYPPPGYPGQAQPGYPPQPQPGYPPQPQAGFGPPPQTGYAPPPQTGYAPPPQPGYAPQSQTHTTVVVAQPLGGALPGANIRYMQSPALIVCQHCQATVTTSMHYEVGLLTWIIVGVLCLFGCWLGCCLIPLCIDATKDVEHRCPNCQNVNGRFRHIS